MSNRFPHESPYHNECSRTLHGVLRLPIRTTETPRDRVADVLITACIVGLYPRPLQFGPLEETMPGL